MLLVFFSGLFVVVVCNLRVLFYDFVDIIIIINLTPLQISFIFVAKAQNLWLVEKHLILKLRLYSTAASCVAVAVSEMPPLRRLLQCGTAAKLT